ARRGMEVPLVGCVDRRPRRGRRARDPDQLLVSGPRTSDAEITHAADVLRDGGLVAFPTETVYGLGADAASPAAVRRLYAVKGRPAGPPVIVHLAARDQLDDWVAEVPDAAARLADACWPGPLTIVLRRAPHVLDAVTGGQDTVALRVPDHPVAL